jgi:signal transduction histidine kinase
MNTTHRHFGLRSRITMLITGILLIVFVVVAYFLVRNVQKTEIRNLNQSSKAFASLATPQIGSTYGIYQNSGSLFINQQIQNYTDLDSNISNVGVINLAGNSVFTQNSSPVFKQTSNTSTFSPTYLTSSDGLITQLIVPYVDTNGQHSYSVAFTVSGLAVRQDIDHQIINIIIFSGIGLIASAAAMYVFTNRFFINPIERLSKQALIISKGQYDQTISLNRNDEIGDLASSVNTMSGSLVADITKLREVDSLKNEFITITSHNLRTPLTIIKGNIELLDDSDLQPDIVGIIASIKESATRLSAFAEDMLTIASIEASSEPIALQHVTIADLTDSLHKTFAAAAKDKGITLHWDVRDPASVVTVSTSRMQAVIRNLLDNAMKFTSQGGRIVLVVALQPPGLIITVSDTGIGISPEEQTKLFTKFHRGTSSMQYDYAGTGIGLYATKLITEAHGGKIAFTSETGKGSSFTVTIPQ